MAQGSVMVSGFGVAGKDGSRVSVNVPERRAHSQRRHGRARGADALRQRAVRDAQSEYARLHHRRAPDRHAQPAARAPAARRRSMRCRSRCRRRPIRPRAWPSSARCRKSRSSPSDAPARVIVNSRTGTVVISSQVRVIAGGGGARLALGDHQRAHRRQPARRRFPRGHHSGHAALGDQCERRPTRACSCSTPASISMRSCAR